MATDKSFTIRKEHPGTKAARMLIGELDAYLDPLYPKESQHGYSIEKLVAQRVEFFVLYEDESPAACGGVQFFDDSNQPGEGYGEIKRMYVRPEFRGRGYAKQMLKHLEELATARDFPRCAWKPGFPSRKPSASTNGTVITRFRRSETTGTTHSASSTRKGWILVRS